MTEAFSKNFIDYEEYPQSADIQNRCVSMIARLYNAPLGGFFWGGAGIRVGTNIY
jgi:glutamate decarboxylase